MPGPDTRVTIIITTHNRGAALLDAVRSARAQSHPATEIVVVDDGSDPPVRDLGPDVRLIRHPAARGVCAARNSGVAAASGDYVMFLDDDDTLPADSVETSLRVIASSSLPQPVAALGVMAVVDDDGHQVRLNRPPTFPRGSGWLFDPRPPGRTLTVQNTLVVPRDVVIGIGGWNEDLRAWVHDDFFLRLARACSLQGCEHVTYRLLEQRDGRGHVSRRLDARARAMERTLADHHEEFTAHPGRHAKFLGTLAMTWLRVGDTRRARAAAWRSFRIRPRRPKAVAQLALTLVGSRAYEALGRTRARARLREQPAGAGPPAR